MMRRKPELLCPAGDWERLKLAVAYGADSVYLAGTAFGMRAFAGNFTPEELPQAVKFAHDHGVKAHVTVNIMPRNDEAAKLPANAEAIRNYVRDKIRYSSTWGGAGVRAPSNSSEMVTPSSFASRGRSSTSG